MNTGLLTIQQFCDRHSLSKATFYRMAKRGEIKGVKVGAHTRITPAQEQDWIDSLPELDVT